MAEMIMTKTKQWLAGLCQEKKEKGLLSFEAATLIYMVASLVFIIIQWERLASPGGMLAARAAILIAMGLAFYVYQKYPCKAAILFRVAIPFLSLIYWYPETYQFCRIHEYQDHIFAQIDQVIFNCQPSLEFSRMYPSTFWHEFYCMGYYSYFYMMIAMVLFYFFARYERFQWATFVFLMSFFLFYVIFDFLPVAGPQYYFQYIGTDLGDMPDLPAVHDYFSNHTEIMPLEVRGPFSNLVLQTQETGENPTAAFPSSHVGMSFITIILAWKSGNRILFFCLFPFFAILCLATVYLKAHYAIDSFAGIVVGLVFYYFTDTIYPLAAKALRLKT